MQDRFLAGRIQLENSAEFDAPPRCSPEQIARRVANHAGIGPLPSRLP